ncbi:MAG TPA: MBL fold metallo-hydrolase [Beijerinckiaceae bacterium]|jgi:ribonuclease BN (tRNA processing enzyme)
MRLTVVGCGDAFGSGGRANTCFLVESGELTLALDFGATSLVALRKLGLDPNRIDAVMLSHLHGDHFGGLPFFLLHGQFDGAREKPLTVIGPTGTAERLDAAMEVFFPGSSKNKWRYPLKVVDLPCRTSHRFGHFEIETHEVVHPSGAPSTGVRVSDGARLLAYSGDTMWTEALFDVARGASLFIIECYKLTKAPPNHLDFETIAANRPGFETSRVMLTHMTDTVLARLAEVEAKGYLTAYDGLVLDV